MNLSIRPMTRADLPEAITISDEAFVDDTLFSWLCPRNKERPIAWRTYLARRMRMRIVQKGVWGYVCVEGGKIVGFAWWSRHVRDAPSTMESKVEKKADVWSNNHTSLFDRMEFALQNMEFEVSEWFKTNEAVDYKRVQEFRSVDSADDALKPLECATTHWMLDVLAVKPSAQRRGVGGAMVQWGIDRCVEESRQKGVHIPICLTASPAGTGLYRRMGFKVVAWQRVLDIENVQFEGGGGVFVWDPSETWIKTANPGTLFSNGMPLDAVWTSRTLEAAAKK